MRLWIHPIRAALRKPTCSSLLYAVAAIGGDRGVEPSSQFFDRVIASSSRFDPFNEVQQWERVNARECCEVCKKGKPCGNTCTEKDDVCHLPPGCAC